MQRLQRSRRASPIVDSNMIPLIDVSLVLLIICMVRTPFLVQQQIRIHLPQSVSSSEVPDRPIVVSIQRDGGLSLNGRLISASSLENAIGGILKTQPQRAMVIQADRDIALQKVVSVMDIAKRLRISKMGLSVEQPK